MIDWTINAISRLTAAVEAAVIPGKHALPVAAIAPPLPKARRWTRTAVPVAKPHKPPPEWLTSESDISLTADDDRPQTRAAVLLPTPAKETKTTGNAKTPMPKPAPKPQPPVPTPKAKPKETLPVPDPRIYSDYREAKKAAAVLAAACKATLLQTDKQKPRVILGKQVRDFPTWLACWSWLYRLRCDQIGQKE